MNPHARLLPLGGLVLLLGGCPPTFGRDCSGDHQVCGEKYVCGEEGRCVPPPSDGGASISDGDGDGDGDGDEDAGTEVPTDGGSSPEGPADAGPDAGGIGGDGDVDGGDSGDSGPPVDGGRADAGGGGSDAGASVDGGGGNGDGGFCSIEVGPGAIDCEILEMWPPQPAASGCDSVPGGWSSVELFINNTTGSTLTDLVVRVDSELLIRNRSYAPQERFVASSGLPALNGRNGQQVRFARDVDGGSEELLPFEIEQVQYWRNGLFVAWVRIPEVPAEGASFRVYYTSETTGPDCQDPRSVWQGYLAVLHMRERANCQAFVGGSYAHQGVFVFDSTGNGNHGFIRTPRSSDELESDTALVGESVRVDFEERLDIPSLNGAAFPDAGYTVEFFADKAGRYFYFEENDAGEVVEVYATDRDGGTVPSRQWLFGAPEGQGQVALRWDYHSVVGAAADENAFEYGFTHSTCLVDAEPIDITKSDPLIDIEWMTFALTSFEEKWPSAVAYQYGKLVTDNLTGSSVVVPGNVPGSGSRGQVVTFGANFGGAFDEVRIIRGSRSSAWIEASDMALWDRLICYGGPGGVCPGDDVLDGGVPEIAAQ